MVNKIFLFLFGFLSLVLFAVFFTKPSLAMVNWICPEGYCVKPTGEKVTLQTCNTCTSRPANCYTQAGGACYSSSCGGSCTCDRSHNSSAKAWAKYVPLCVVTSVATCDWAWSYNTATCSTGDKCRTETNNPYLNYGRCNCTMGNVYKTCCAGNELGGSCNQFAGDTTNPPWEGSCPGGTTTVICNAAGLGCPSNDYTMFGGYRCTADACGVQACGAAFAPDPPTGLAVSTSCNGPVTVDRASLAYFSWSANPSDQAVTAYRLYYRKVGAASWSGPYNGNTSLNEWRPCAPSTSCDAVSNGFSYGQQMQWYMTAVNRAGVSGATAVKTFTTKDCSAVGSDLTIRIYNDPNGNESGTVLYTGAQAKLHITNSAGTAIVNPDPTVNATGTYTLTALADGTYPITITPPPGYSVSLGNNKKDGALPPNDTISFYINPTPPTCTSLTVVAGEETRNPGQTAHLSANGCTPGIPGETLTYTWLSPAPGTYTPSSLNTAVWNAPNPYYADAYATPTVNVCETPSGGCVPMALSNGVGPNPGDTNSIHIIPLFYIKGNVYIDSNKNNKLDAGEPNYSAVAPKIDIYDNLSCSGSPVVSVNSVNGVYDTRTVPLFKGLTVGDYSVCYTNINNATGYYPQWPKGAPPEYSVNVGNSCVANGLATGVADPCTAEGNIDGLNFGITDSVPWFQSIGGDFYQNPFVDPIPADASTATPPYGGAGIYASVFGAGGTPGVIYSGGIAKPDFGPVGGKASSPGWVIGGIQFPETYVTTGAPLSTSYDNIDSLIDKYGKRSQVINLSDPSQITASGIYSTTGDLTFAAGSGFTLSGNKKVIILVKGDLYINERIFVENGSTLFITTKGSINIDKSVGETASSYCKTPWDDPTHTGCSIEGYYSSDHNFNIKGNVAAGCPTGDPRLNIGGSIVANALGVSGGGGISIERDLCTDGATYPVLSITERPDFILNSPEFFMTRRRVWQEVAP